MKSNILCLMILFAILVAGGCATFPDNNTAVSNPISEIASLPYRITKWFTDLLKPLGGRRSTHSQYILSADALEKRTIYEKYYLNGGDDLNSDKDAAKIGYWVRAR